MRMIWNDFRFSLRMFTKHPLVTSVTVLTLTLGIGANTAIFSVMNAVLLRPLPFHEAERLVIVSDTFRAPGSESPDVSVSPPNFDALQHRTQSFERVGAFVNDGFNVTGAHEPERVEGGRFSADVLPTFGVQPLLGRNFLPEEDRPGNPAPVALISHSYWQRQFGTDPQILNQPITINDVKHTIVGVLPASFRFPFNAELWVPLALDPHNATDRQRHILGIPARIKPGKELQEVQTELNLLAAQLEKEYPETNSGWGFLATPIREELTGNFRPGLLALSAAVGLLLLIVCANVASLQLARSTVRQKEVAIRSAIGASRGRIVQQFLIESLVLSSLGGVLGLMAAYWCLPLLRLLVPSTTLVTFFRDLSLDHRVFGFTLVVTVVTGMMFGALPAIKAARIDLTSVLSQGGRTAGTQTGRRVLSGFVVAEIALATVLLVGTALVVQRLQQLLKVDLGFQPEQVLTLRIDLPIEKYPEPQQREAFYTEVLDRIQAIPGVVAVGGTSELPLTFPNTLARLTVEGRPPASASEVLTTTHRLITPGYLTAMRIPILKGRALDQTDMLPDAPGVVMVSAGMAHRFWPGQEALGKRVKRGGPDSTNPWLTVVGVVADVVNEQIDDPNTSAWYLPRAPHDRVLSTDFSRNVTLAVQTSGEPTRLSRTICEAIWAVDRHQPVYEIAPLTNRIGAALAQNQFRVWLFGIFAAVGLTLAAAGIYGLIAYSMTQRTQEIGIRMALGAHPNDILKLMLAQGIGCALGGLGIGITVAAGLAQMVNRLLFSVPAFDIATFSTISLVLIVVSGAAAYFPARQAARLDPLAILRHNSQ